MAKTRLTNDKRERILNDVMQRLDLGDVRAKAVARLRPAYDAVAKAVERQCPKKDLKVLKKYACTRSSSSPTIRTEKGMARDADFWRAGGRELQGKKQLNSFVGPDQWTFFDRIQVTEDEMDLFEEYQLARGIWNKARIAAKADFNAVIYSAKNVEDLEEVLPLDATYFTKYKKANQALSVAGDVVARVKSAKLEPKK